MMNVIICWDSNFFFIGFNICIYWLWKFGIFIVECLKMSYIIIVKNEKLDLRFKILVYLNIIV